MPRVPARHIVSLIGFCPVMSGFRDGVVHPNCMLLFRRRLVVVRLCEFFQSRDWRAFLRNWFPYFSILSVLLTVNQLPAILETLIFVTLVPKEGPSLVSRFGFYLGLPTRLHLLRKGSP